MTYAWINATVTSSIISMVIGTALRVKVFGEIREKFDSRLISRCPATMFAMRRTASVMGRIICLITSISTMKFIRAVGVPKGVRWAIVFLVKLPMALIITTVHSVRLYRSVVEIWAVGVKLKGRMAVRFMSKIL